MTSPTARPKPLAHFALALAVASFGGMLFALLGIPLPFILGAMIFCLLATLIKLPVATPAIVRPPMSAVIGVMLGSGFTPDIVSSIADWIVPLVGLALFLVTAALICVTFYHKVAGYDAATAYFAGMPGGLMEMTLLGESYGADTRRIALAHSARILIVVFTLPFLVQQLSGQDISRGPLATGAPFTLESILWLAGTAIVGVALGHLFRLPARVLLGPMAVSAIVHAAGLTSFKPPAEIVIIAQLVLGASIGCRFAGVAARELGQVLLLALGSTALLLTLTLSFSYAVSPLVPFSPVELMLAYSPGGLTEMGLIALALNTDVAFVAGHHIVRVVMVSSGAAFSAPRFVAPHRLERRLQEQTVETASKEAE